MVDITMNVGVLRQGKFPETLFDLDKAIAMHLENKRESLGQIDNAALVKAAKIHIKVFETAPRNSARLEGRIAIRQQEMERTIDTVRHQEFSIEIQTLQRLLGMVRTHESGEALDGLAY